jgi:hypothetical protein
MMGTKKVGALSSPRKKATVIIISEHEIASNFFSKYFSMRIRVPLDLTLPGNSYIKWTRSYEPAKHHSATMKSGDVRDADEIFEVGGIAPWLLNSRIPEGSRIICIPAK